MVFASAKTSPAVIEKLNIALRKALETSAVRERMVKDGFDPLPGTSAEARARLEKEMPMWSQLIKERGITAE